VTVFGTGLDPTAAFSAKAVFLAGSMPLALPESVAGLQGTVVAGTVRSDGTAVRFEVEYACVTVPVRHEGARPPLFKEGMPVVVLGSFVDGTEKSFASDQIIVSHTNEYKEDEADRLAEAEQEACPS